jgi:hypothetical protein
MSSTLYNAEETALAAKLHAIGVERRREAQVRRGLLIHAPLDAYADLDEPQRAAWCEIARYVLTQPRGGAS